MCIKNLSVLTIIFLSVFLLSCETTLDLSAPIDTSTPKGKVRMLKRQIKTYENSLYNTAKEGKFFNVNGYLQRMIDKIENVKTHVDKKFHAELDEVVSLYAKAIKDYKKTKSYLVVDHKFKSGKKKLRKTYKKIMLEFDQKKTEKSDQKSEKKPVEKSDKK